MVLTHMRGSLLLHLHHGLSLGLQLAVA